MRNPPKIIINIAEQFGVSGHNSERYFNGKKMNGSYAYNYYNSEGKLILWHFRNGRFHREIGAALINNYLPNGDLNNNREVFDVCGFTVKKI